MRRLLPMKGVFHSRKFQVLLLWLLVGGLTGCQSPEKSCCRRPLAMAPGVTKNSILDLDQVWQDDNGKDFCLAELRGHPVVISMFFASCEGVCVITKNDFKAIEASLPAAVRDQTLFILVTLAPERDTPAALKNYRAEQGLSEKRWRLLRGSAAATARLAAQLGIGYGRDGSGRFKHSSALTVLDRAGKISLQQDGLHPDLAATVKVLASAAGR